MHILFVMLAWVPYTVLRRNLSTFIHPMLDEGLFSLMENEQPLAGR
jgi:hypothetical protein